MRSPWRRDQEQAERDALDRRAALALRRAEVEALEDAVVEAKALRETQRELQHQLAAMETKLASVPTIEFDRLRTELAEARAEQEPAE